MFVAGITNTQRLTATVEQAVNRLNYTFIVIKTDTIKILAKKPEYHKIITDILKEKKVELHTHKPRQQRAYRAVIRNVHYSMQQKLVREEIESMEHTIGNIWNIRRRVAGNPLSLFFSDIEPAAENNEIYIEYHKT
jgi:galactokinase/mevalonate kinase-like predicted kinase